MIRPLIALLLCALAAVPVQAAHPTRLGERIDSLIAQPRFAQAQWGIEVVSLDSGRTLYAHNADKLFIPASTTKLFTSALALDMLGADFRITTQLLGRQPDHRGTVEGPVVLYGMGDPTLGTQAVSPDWGDQLAAQLTARGVRRIHGDLVADDTYFQGPPYGFAWEVSDLQARFGAPPSALTVAENAVQVVVGPSQREGATAQLSMDPAWGIANTSNTLVTSPAGTSADINLYRAPGSTILQAFGSIPAGASSQRFNLSMDDPARVAATMLRDALQRHGVEVSGGVIVTHWPEDTTQLRANLPTLAQLSSPPLGQILNTGLKQSQNLYMQDLLLAAGAAVQARQAASSDRTGFVSTEEWAIIGLRLVLDRIGIAPGESLIREGSGLTRANLATPRAMNRLLAALAARNDASVFMDALPVAGVDGTLANRMKGTAAEGNLRAKTGTLTQVYALAGFVTSAAGERLAFTILLNNYAPPEGAPRATADIDAIAVMLADEGK